MAKYHINSNGVPSICRAEKGNCPFGDEGTHFESRETAQEFINFMSEEEHGLLPSMSPRERQDLALNKLNELHDELVPEAGKADTVAGEMVRAISRIGYRFYNDGDQVGSGYGNETCNSSLRYLAEKLEDTKGAEELSVELDKLWQGDSMHDNEYENQINICVEEITDFIESNPELRELANEDDSTADFREPQDYNYDDEWDDEWDDDYEDDYEDQDLYGNEWEDDYL